MANIGIDLHHNATKYVHWGADNPNCIGISIECDLPPATGGGQPIPYARDKVMLHGSVDEMRSFAQKIISALPAVATTEPDKRAVEASIEASHLRSYAGRP